MNVVEINYVHPEKLAPLAQMVLDEAKRKGATQAEVAIAANKGFSVSAHNFAVEKVEYHQDKVIEIKVYFGKCSGSASLSDLSHTSIRSAVEAACHIAKFTGQDEFAGLADKKELAFNYPTLELAFPWKISVEQAIELACECERQACSQDARILNAEEVNVSTGEALNLYANSHGFIGYYPHTRHEIACILVAKNKKEMQRDYSYSVAIDPAKLNSINNIAREAVDRAIKRLGASKLSTRKVPVIFIAEEARGLIDHFLSAIKGGSIYRKSSFLVDHLEKAIFPSFMHIQEFPHLAYGLGSAPFDDNGVATRENIFIEEGILKSYALNVYAARKLGLSTTGNAGGVHNLTVKTGNQDLATLLKTMNTGLLVTELMGQGVNLLTGDYSRGASGFWVEHGEIQYPVHEITIAGNLKEIFANIVAIANDVDVRGNIRTGSILVSEMMIAGS